jgi:F-type H+-transporting ATPase subunit delta
MIRTGFAKRYAQAIFEIARERNEFDLWQEGLGKIVQLAADPKWMALQESPSISFDAKTYLLEERLGTVPPMILNLASLLVSKGLLKRSGDILQRYIERLDIHRGIKRANVTTAVPIGEDEKEAISRRLGEMTNRKVMIDAHVDPSILGGFIARIGDTLIDGSIHQKLETLKKRLVQGDR